METIVISYPKGTEIESIDRTPADGGGSGCAIFSTCFNKCGTQNECSPVWCPVQFTICGELTINF